MRIPNAVHQAEAWRIRSIVPDFTLEDVWALPAHGGPDDFHRLIDFMLTLDPADARGATRLLWRARDFLGRWLDLGRVRGGPGEEPVQLLIPGTVETSLRGRLSDDLQGTADDVDFRSVPFVALFKTDVEFAAEISNKTVHGVLHLAWAELRSGEFGGQLAIYVKPRGTFGRAYMVFIKPFRSLIVYPALMRKIAREWETR